jgi:hypothetical protein
MPRIGMPGEYAGCAIVFADVNYIRKRFLFAGYALVDGVTSLVGAVRDMEHHDRWGVLVLGL